MSSEGHPQQEPAVWARQRAPTAGVRGHCPGEDTLPTDRRERNSIQQRQKLVQDSLGHAPNNVILVAKDARVDLYSASIDRLLVPGLSTRERGERKPECERYLLTEKKWFITINEREVWPDNDRRKPHRARTEIVQHSDHHALPREIDPRFFARLSDRGFGERCIARFHPSPRKGYLTAPGISFVLRPLDEKQLQRFVLAEAEDQRDCGFANALFVFGCNRAVRSEC